MAVRSKKAEENLKLLTEKTNKIFSTVSILLRRVPGCLRGSHVASSDFRGSQIASRGNLFPQGIAGGLQGSGVAFGVTDGLVGLQMASGAAGGFVGSWEAMGGR
jgi:hypothetical protein